jgi:hypothetical protein
MIDPALDVWVWVAALVLLVMLGARAWVVETGQGRLGRTPVKVRVLTAGVFLALAGLVSMLAMQGGTLLVSSIITGTDPSAVYYGSDDQAGGDDHAGDPNAPAGQPPAGQPPAGQPPAGQPPAEQPPAGQPPAGG